MDRARLATLLRAPQPTHYADVLERLTDIGTAVTPSDALYWFNRLYLQMTQAVVNHADRIGFRDPVFLEALDCAFAELYFDALRALLHDRERLPRAWAPLFEADGRRDVVGLQYALAGVNAHINRDLPVALGTTFARLGVTPDRRAARYADYRVIDQVLAGTEAEAKSWLLTDALGRIERALGAVDDLLALWSIARAREAAWTSAEVRWHIRESALLSEYDLCSLDRIVGFASRALLRSPIASASRGSAPAHAT